MSNIKNGVSKFFSNKGREKKEVKEVKPEKKDAAKPSYDDEIIKEVALSKYPEAEHVLDKRKTLPTKQQKLLTVLREESWFDGKS